MSTEQEDQLQRAYRDASSDAAGVPPPGLRKAILAEAAAAARRREPANDARYWLSAAAGIAVLGVGLVLWRQVPHELPGDAPVTAEMTEAAVQAAPQASVAQADAAADAAGTAPLARAGQESPPAVADPVPQLAREQRSADAAAPAAKAELEETRRSAPLAVPMQEAADIARNTSSPQLLRQHFPQAYADNLPRTLWLVQDAAGNTLRSGELAAGLDFATINPGIEAQFTGQRLGPWVIEEVRNPRGQPIKLGIARLQYNPGQ